MATKQDYIEYVLERLDGLGAIARKMFGEYQVYLNGRPVFLVCDDTVFVKKHDFLENKKLETGRPYPGAKEHYILNPENTATLRKTAIEVEKITPLPKPRKKQPAKPKPPAPQASRAKNTPSTSKP